MRRQRRDGRHPERGPLVSLLWSMGLIAAALLVLAPAGASFGTGLPTCPYPGAGALLVAVDNSPSAIWYTARNPAPPLTDQIASFSRTAFPGSRAVTFAYVKNTGRTAGTPSIRLTDLVDTGGKWTASEKRLEPTVDVGDLSANIDVEITYASSLRPASTYTVARGTLRELAAGGRAFSAPVSLAPYSSRRREIGNWRIALSVPAAADNRIQGDTATWGVWFGLTVH